MTPDAYDSAPPRGTELTWTRLYQRGGRQAHLTADSKIACRGPLREDAWVDESWLGTGSQEEYEHAAALPLCRRCFACREAAHGGEGYDPASRGT